MTYDEVLSAIHSRKAFSSCASLERISRLMERLGNPQDQIRCIHVAGTNGKGSICAYVESALRASGYRVGLFTSPYLIDFRERIQIDRQMISEEQLISCYHTVMREEYQLEQEGFEPINEFELVTAIGFTAFFTAKVDFAVIEVGLGGRYDATNVLSKPEVCCIAPIALDHTAVLGDTLAAIAGEKAGIIKPNCPVVTARQPEEVYSVILSEAKRQNAPLSLPEDYDLLSSNYAGTMIEYRGRRFNIPLLGRYQADNAVTAWEVCRRINLKEADIQAGIEETRWPGRLQYISGQPDFLIDAGHNPAGIQAVCETLDTLFAGRAMITVMAMMRDKDYATCIPMIAGRSERLIAASCGLPRSLPPDELSALAARYCPVCTAGSVDEGVQLARSMAQNGQMILVCGSVYAAGDALRTIE